MGKITVEVKINTFGTMLYSLNHPNLSWKINDFFYIKYDSSDSAVWTQSLIKD